VLQIALGAGQEIVEGGYTKAFGQQAVAKMRSDKTRRTGNYRVTCVRHA
jgi:hypothetical protein